MRLWYGCVGDGSETWKLYWKYSSSSYEKNSEREGIFKIFECMTLLLINNVKLSANNFLKKSLTYTQYKPSVC